MLYNTSCCLLVLILKEFDVAVLLCVCYFILPALLIFYYLYIAFLLFPCSLAMAPVFFLITDWRQHDIAESETNILTVTLDYVCDI